MNTEQIDQIILANAHKIDLDRNDALRQCLAGMDERTALAAFAELKSPTTVLLVSIFLGTLGIDRFILAQKFLGILKLVTAGGCFIWTIIDWFTSGDRTRTYNTRMLLARLRSPEVADISAAPADREIPSAGEIPSAPSAGEIPSAPSAGEIPSVPAVPETLSAPSAPAHSE